MLALIVEPSHEFSPHCARFHAGIVGDLCHNAIDVAAKDGRTLGSKRLAEIGHCWRAWHFRRYLGVFRSLNSLVDPANGRWFRCLSLLRVGMPLLRSTSAVQLSPIPRFDLVVRKFLSLGFLAGHVNIRNWWSIPR